MRITEIGRILPSLLFVLFFAILSVDQTEQKDLISTESSNKEAITKDKYTKSGISDEESTEIYKILNDYLKTTKTYTDPDMTLDSLANKLNISRHKLSQAINRESGKRFYTIINLLRLEEFILAIDENRYPNYTIISIAFECGFKSSSAFYSFFKKRYGTTPKEFIKNS